MSGKSFQLQSGTPTNSDQTLEDNRVLVCLQHSQMIWEVEHTLLGQIPIGVARMETKTDSLFAIHTF